MPTELGALQAIFTADTTNFDAGIKRVEAGTHIAEGGMNKFTNSLKEVGAASVVLEGPFGGISSRLRGLSTLANELEGSFGVVGIGIAGFGAALVSAGGLIFELSKKTAEFGEDLFKAHEKTALSIETLSALKIAGAEVGVELSTMTTGLVRFTQNLEMAAAGNKKLSAEFKQLGVTAFHDNNTALQQFITSFAQLRTDQERTVAAGAIFGVRFGAALVEVFNQVGGNVDAFKDKLYAMGLIMSKDDVQASHDFDVQLKLVQEQLGGLARTVGAQVIPVLTKFFQDLSQALAENKDAWRSWGTTIADTLSGLRIVAQSELGQMAKDVAAFTLNGIKDLWLDGFRFVKEKQQTGRRQCGSLRACYLDAWRARGAIL